MLRSLAAGETLEYQAAGCRSRVAGEQLAVNADFPVRTPAHRCIAGQPATCGFEWSRSGPVAKWACSMPVPAAAGVRSGLAHCETEITAQAAAA